MDTRVTTTAIEVGWFIATLVGLDYSIKTLGTVKTLWWTFGITLLVNLGILVSVAGIAYRNAVPSRFLLVPGILSMQAAIYAVAWWTLWKRKPSARAWGVGASLLYVLPSVFNIWSSIHHSRSIRGCSGIMLAIGVIGLVAFLRNEQHEPIRNCR